MTPLQPILVLDSGLGGLTVARAIHEALPNEKVLYFGDTARVPYGSKSPETVAAFVSQIVRYLRPYGPKHVVVACNTASAVALPQLREAFPELSISGVVEPGAKAAAVAAGAEAKPTIGVIATEATIRSRAYERAISQRRHKAKLILRSTPLLVPIIEEGRDGRDPLVRLCLEQYLGPLLSRNISVLVLGCTHYPLLRSEIEQTVGPAVTVIDSAAATAEDVAARLTAMGLLRPAFVSGASVAGWSDESEAGEESWLRCFTSDNTPRFRKLATRFLGRDVAEPTLVSPELLYAGAEACVTRLSA